VELQLPTQQAALSGLARRDVRERVYNASINRGATGGENDTRATILETVKLRARAASITEHTSRRTRPLRPPRQ
jgi:peptidyl-dipeptidase Dcp